MLADRPMFGECSEFNLTFIGFEANIFFSLLFIDRP